MSTIDNPNPATLPVSADRTVWAGRVLTFLAAAFLVMDATMKLLALDIVMSTNAELGWTGDAATARMQGIILIVITLLYIWPRTAVLGAILITAYLGGAIATHLRIGNPLFTHTLFGVYVGLFVWAGLYLRLPRLRALLPLIR